MYKSCQFCMRYLCDIKMTKITIFIICMCFMDIIYSRPADNVFENESDMDEMDYEENKEVADPSDEPDSRAKIRDFSINEDMKPNRRFLANINKNSFISRFNNKDHGDPSKIEISEFKQSKKDGMEDNVNEKTNNGYDNVEGYARDYSRYSQGIDEVDQPDAQRLNNQNFMQNQIHNNLLAENPSEKKSGVMKVNEDNDLLFEYKKDDGKAYKGDFNNEPLLVNADYSKQFLNQIRLENRPLEDNRHHDYARLYISRDRRDADNVNSQPNNAVNTESDKDNIAKSKDDDEQMAIKRHIKKLTDEELQELLNSLSEDKRALLKKIIDDGEISEVDGINKREITKKAQAVDGNSYSDNSKSDISNLEGSVTLSESAAPNTETTEINKPAESKTDNIESVKSIESKTNVEIQNQMDNLQKKEEVSNSDAKLNDKSEIVPSDVVTTKNDIKRDCNPGSFSDVSDDSKVLENNVGKDSPANQVFAYSSDELNPFLDEDKQPNTDSGHINKRDIDNQIEFDSKMKSLEESFPNSDAYDESPGPLIRVKRKNTDTVMKKRSAGVLPDAKVAYLSYKTENDEEADEGNEFDDDGFYERNPNVCNSDNRNVLNENKLYPNKKYVQNFNPSSKDLTYNVNEPNKDTNNLGTDTDSVLSGVEGVDENLMYNTNSRIRRTSNENNIEDADTSLQNIDSKSVNEDNKESSLNNMSNDPNYQENDAFGALPHNYEGDLGRYKRIRRVKQSHTDETISNT